VAGKRRRGPLREGTIDHFRAWAGLLVLDTGETLEARAVPARRRRRDPRRHPEVWLDVPEGNGKTTLMGGVALYHGDTHPERDGPDGRRVARPDRHPAQPGIEGSCSAPPA
jgi:hypothetical protein